MTNESTIYPRIFALIVAFALLGLFAFEFFDSRLKKKRGTFFANTAGTVFVIVVSQAVLYFILRMMLC